MSYHTPIVEHTRLRLGDLKQHPKNPRQGDKDLLRQSIQKYGQARELLVQQDTFVIVAGNHTAQVMGEEYGLDIMVDVAIVAMDNDTAEEFALMDNRTTDKATWDSSHLAEVLKDIAARDTLENTGFDQDDIDDILVTIGAIEPPPTQEFTGGYAEPEEETAARWEGREEGKSREVVFLLLEEDFEKFNELVGELQKSWGLTSKAETINQAVQYAHRSQNANALPDKVGVPQKMTITPIVEGTGFPQAGDSGS